MDCALSPTSDRYWSTGWRILRQSEVRPIFMVVAHILGYPYNVDNFFNMPGERFPNVPVSPNETTEGVVVKLGARAAYLDFDISDEAGNPEDLTAYFWRPDHNKGPEDWAYSMHVNAHQRSVAVPPVPFGVTLEAEGFASWSYGGDQRETNSRFIRLKSGETRLVRVLLKKSQ